MKIQVELLSVLAYTDKKTNEPKTRLAYRCLGSKYNQYAKNKKGFSELSIYLDTHDLFNKLSSDMFGVQAELEFEEKPSVSNPLKNLLTLKTIKVGNNIVTVS